MSAIKKELHELIDGLSDDDAAEVLKELRGRRDDPVRWALEHAPIDDEPVTDEDRAAIAEAEASLSRGEAVSHEELKRRLGL